MKGNNKFFITCEFMQLKDTSENWIKIDRKHGKIIGKGKKTPYKNIPKIHEVGAYIYKGNE